MEEVVFNQYSISVGDWRNYPRKKKKMYKKKLEAIKQLSWNEMPMIGYSQIMEFIK